MIDRVVPEFYIAPKVLCPLCGSDDLIVDVVEEPEEVRRAVPEWIERMKNPLSAGVYRRAWLRTRCHGCGLFEHKREL